MPIVADFVQLWKDVAERRGRLSAIMSRRDIGSGDVYSDELAEIERRVQEDTRRVDGYVDELHQLGVLPNGPEGLVEFPTIIDGTVG